MVASGLLVNMPASAAGKSGTTLAAVKTIDICDTLTTDAGGREIWRYSGEIAVWNEGAVATTGFTINDFIQVKCGSGQFVNKYVVPLENFSPAIHEIAAGTTQATADVYTYFVEAPAVDLTTCFIRNVANCTITNHSGQTVGTPFGPSPKATWMGGTPPPCAQADQGGCTFSQGYWGNKPDVIWPSPYDRSAIFFLSNQTWQQVMDTPVNVSQGYYQLAHQYIAALLNQANGAAVPSGVQDTLNQATTWFQTNGPANCTGKGSCGIQKDWAGILDSYNNGLYPGGPSHCSEE
jgi:hypothetical protein